MKKLLPALVFALTAGPAFAHLPSGEYGSVASGFTHPLTGLDHILAMVAVGLWASLIGGRALWMVPLAFVGAMFAGFGLSLAGVSLPVIEPMILASTVVLGLSVAAAFRPDVRICAALVGFFALFHGAAHGGELGQATALKFGFGFVVATALLHVAGIALGLGAERFSRRFGATGVKAVRGLGVLTAALGLSLAIG